MFCDLFLIKKNQRKREKVLQKKKKTIYKDYDFGMKAVTFFKKKLLLCKSTQKGKSDDFKKPLLTRQGNQVIEKKKIESYPTNDT